MQRETLRIWALLALCVPLSNACGAEDDAGSGPSGAPGDAFVVTSAGRVVNFDRATGAVTSSLQWTGLAADDELIGADARPSGTSIHVVTRAGKVYAANADRTALVVISSLFADPSDTTDPFQGLEGEVFSVDFNPVVDRLRIVSDTGQNLRVNVDTGATITDAPLNPGAPSVEAASYSNSFGAACRTQLYVIDASSDSLMLQDPPNAGTLREVGPLGLGRGPGSGVRFEIATSSDGRGNALALWPSSEGADLYDIDVRTGAASNGRRLRLRPGETVIGLSARPASPPPRQAVGEVLGVSETNQLISFNTAAPSKLCTRDPITGLGDDEEVLGIDVRPTNGAVYALTSAGLIYTIDPDTAEATPRARLAADPGDDSAPFVGLVAGDYGMGFNPVPDRLRLVSRGGANLRINVDTGATITDSPVSPSSMAVPALAYTNAFAGATSTALYAIDAAGGSLLLIGDNPASGGACPDDLGNPNCGSAREVGPLGLTDMTDVGGFDIEAGADVGWAALNVGTDLFASLFVVDLASAAVSLPPGVADSTIGGHERLRAITFLPRTTARP